MDATPLQTTFDHRRAMIWLIAAGALARLVFASTTGLGIDETYMVALGRHWEWSYFDHPPLAWWLSHAASALAGSEAAAVVRAPFIALFALSTWLMWRLGAMLYGATAGFIAALAMNCAPVLGVTTGTWVLPDGPLDAALLAATLCLAQILFAPKASPALWLLAGLFGGLATLSKLHGLFPFAGTGLFLLASAPHRVWLARPWPYLGGMVALVVLTPAILWNVQHDWASLAFQGARAATRAFRPWMPLVALAGQAAFLAPWIWAPLIRAVWTTLRDQRLAPPSLFLACLGAGPVVFFTLVSAWSDQKPYFHWAAPGYLLWLPLLGHVVAAGFDAGSRRIRRWLTASVLFDLAAIAAVIALSVFPQIVGAMRGLAPRLGDPLAEMVDWNDADAYLRQRGIVGDSRVFVVARRWYEAAKIDYALHGAIDVVCIGEDCRGYDYVRNARDHMGDDAIVMVPENAVAPAIERIAAQFAGVEPLPALEISHGPLTIARMQVFRAKSYRPAAR